MALTLPLWLLCFPALLGLAFGSFLNVCIVRLPKGESVVHPRSQCPKCKTPLTLWQNIPLLSWILLRGRCHNCHKTISPMYPAVELAYALWFVYCTVLCVHSRTGLSVVAVVSAISMAVLGWLLLGLFLTDIRDGLLPNSFTLGGGLLGILLLAASTVGLPADPGTVFFTTPEKIVALRILAVIIAGGALLLLRWLYRRLRGREGMGMGDVKMTVMLTAFLGLGATVLAFMVATVVGSLYALVLLLRGKRPTEDGHWALRGHAVPFGSFLAIGGFYVMLAGHATLAWYISLLR